MQDRELLELAAQAVGHKIYIARQAERDAAGSGSVGLWLASGHTCWNPLTDDGDALRLAVALRIDVRLSFYQGTASRPHDKFVQVMVDRLGRCFSESSENDPAAATRRAIVRADAAFADAQAA